jgi:lysophospholipase L1-like esterase
VQVVTLTVGGNEIFDAFQTQDPAQVQAALRTFIGNYNEILSRLRAAAGSDMPIITMTYFNPLPYCGYAQYGDATNYVLEALPTPYGKGLNGIIRTLSAAHGAVPAEVFGTLGAGDFFDCKHPNASGYAKITTAFEAAWQTATAPKG